MTMNVDTGVVIAEVRRLPVVLEVRDGETSTRLAPIDVDVPITPNAPMAVFTITDAAGNVVRLHVKWDDLENAERMTVVLAANATPHVLIAKNTERTKTVEFPDGRKATVTERTTPTPTARQRFGFGAPD